MLLEQLLFFRRQFLERLLDDFVHPFQFQTLGVFLALALGIFGLVLGPPLAQFGVLIEVVPEAFQRTTGRTQKARARLANFSRATSSGLGG